MVFNFFKYLLTYKNKLFLEQMIGVNRYLSNNNLYKYDTDIDLHDRINNDSFIGSKRFKYK